MILNYYNKDIDKVIKELSSNIDKGLTKEEVLKRRKQSGINEITDTNKITPLKRFLMQFNNAMIILLLIVGILSLIYSYVTKTDYTDAFVILFSVIVNAIMGYIQEKKAEDSLETLKSYVTSKVKVIREGKNFEVDSKDLVIGDIITLESGDKIPADSRIIKSINALVDESILTGESQSVEKTKEVIEGEQPLHERKNMVYSGTLLTNGKIIAIITEIGNNTELGKLAVKRLIGKIENSTQVALRVFVPATLVERDSVGDLSEGNNEVPAEISV